MERAQHCQGYRVWARAQVLVAVTVAVAVLVEAWLAVRQWSLCTSCCLVRMSWRTH